MRLLFLIACSSLLCSCEKKELPEEEPAPVTVTTELRRGLPEDQFLIHGFLYNSNNISRLGANYYNNSVIAASFGDPKRNLLAGYSRISDNFVSFQGQQNSPNVSIGRLTFNGITINNGFGTGYYLKTSLDTTLFLEKLTWTAEGNRTFKPFSLTLPQTGPKLKSSLVNFSLTISSGYELNFNELFSDYDSIAVMIHSNFSFPTIYKSQHGSNPVIKFSPSELNNLKSRTTANIVVMGFNYSNKIIEDKIYIFESGTKLERILTIKP